jgi:hypothetical protein
VGNTNIERLLATSLSSMVRLNIVGSTILILTLMVVKVFSVVNL